MPSEVTEGARGLGPRGSLRGGRVLLVEDDVVMRETLARCLRREGASVAEAGDGLEGLGNLRRDDFDLIISDINMPRMNGLEFLRGAKDLSRSPVLLMTGEPRFLLDASELEAQAVGLIRKPMALRDFVEAVSTHLKAPAPAAQLAADRWQRGRLTLDVVWSAWFLGLWLYLHFVATSFSGAFFVTAIVAPVLLRWGIAWLFYR